jgi:coatomer subunit gamma
MYDLLEGWLRHKSDMVNYEAARAICEMRGVTPPQLSKAISGKNQYRIYILHAKLISPVLQLFLSSPRSTLKFAATRTLATLAVAYPQSVAACNVDLENLISDPNRSVATYAITTLLKVCLCIGQERGSKAHFVFRLAMRPLWIAL